MIYSIEELKKRINPVAEKYELPVVYLFGSYARNEADDNSDVDILIDRSGSKIHSMFDMGALYSDLCDSVGKEIDLVTTQTLDQESTLKRTPWFIDNLERDRVKIYEQRR